MFIEFKLLEEDLFEVHGLKSLAHPVGAWQIRVSDILPPRRPPSLFFYKISV
jgi:hypothetical protein